MHKNNDVTLLLVSVKTVFLSVFTVLMFRLYSFYVCLWSFN